MAPNTDLPRSAERLLTRHIDSVGALDLLLLLHGARDRDWSAEELCAAVGCPPSWAEGQVARLAALDLVAEAAPGRYRYRRGREYGPAVDALARACRRDRSAVVRLIFTKPSRRPGQFAR